MQCKRSRVGIEGGKCKDGWHSVNVSEIAKVSDLLLKTKSIVDGQNNSINKVKHGHTSCTLGDCLNIVVYDRTITKMDSGRRWMAWGGQPHVQYFVAN